MNLVAQADMKSLVEVCAVTLVVCQQLQIMLGLFMLVGQPTPIQ